jgi:hypothetical protein
MHWKLRYVAAALITALAICIIAIVVLEFKSLNVGISLKYEEWRADELSKEQANVQSILGVFKWLALLLLASLSALLAYRWFIRPSVP